MTHSNALKGVVSRDKMLELNKIHQGDCLELLKQIPDNSIDCIITDPPYGIDYQSARRTDKTLWKPKIANDKTPFVWFLKDAFRVLKENSCLICFTRYDTENAFRQAMKWAGFTPKAQIIWDKEIHGMGDLNGDFAPQHENLIFATKGKFKFPSTRPRTILRFQRVNAEKLIHPNEKPVKLLENLIQSLTTEEETVLDCFIGGGSLAVACKNTRRNFIGIELNPTYVEIANKRLNQTTLDSIPPQAKASGILEATL